MPPPSLLPSFLPSLPSGLPPSPILRAEPTPFLCFPSLSPFTSLEKISETNNSGKRNDKPTGDVCMVCVRGVSEEQRRRMQ